MTRASLAAAAAALALALAAAPPPAAAQPAASPEAREAARSLVEAMDGRRQFVATLQQLRGLLISNIQQQSPKVAPAEVARVVDEILMPEFEARSGEVVEATAAIWAGRLSVEEMKQLAAFYATPLGRKVLAAAPEVAGEAMRFGQAWAARVAAEAISKHREALRARGFNL